MGIYATVPPHYRRETERALQNTVQHNTPPITMSVVSKLHRGHKSISCLRATAMRQSPWRRCEKGNNRSPLAYARGLRTLKKIIYPQGEWWMLIMLIMLIILINNIINMQQRWSRKRFKGCSWANGPKVKMEVATLVWRIGSLNMSVLCGTMLFHGPGWT